MASTEQKELANFIKTVHHSLRNVTSKQGFDDAWEEHCKDEATLKKYAEAMHVLAVNYWGKKSKDDPSHSRIIWVFNQCMHYFKDGLLLKAREKEFHLSSVFNFPLSESLENSAEFHPPFRLLDVGSCYNPFRVFPEFQTVAIDLMPATEDVSRCDYLKVPLVDEERFSLKQTDRECTSLPKNYFDIVVFSLFLEYIPSSVKRFECCLKAHELLRPEGILVILTPDSSHESANSKLLRGWRLNLAKIGFFRVTYEKLRHLHGLIFRKCIDPRVSQQWCQHQNDNTETSESLPIPQDVSDFMTNSQIMTASKPAFVKTCQDESNIASDFSFLPNISFEEYRKFVTFFSLSSLKGGKMRRMQVECNLKKASNN